MLAQGQEDRRAETTDLFVPTPKPLSVKESRKKEAGKARRREREKAAKVRRCSHPPTRSPFVRTRVASTRALILFRAPTRQATATFEEQASGQEDSRGGRLLNTGTSTLAAAASQGIWGTLKARRQPSHRTALNK